MLAIKPAIDPPKNIAKKLLYPYAVYRIKVYVKRPFKPPRTFELVISVDKFRAKGFISDIFPELIEDEGEIIPSRLNDEQADKVARRTALYYTLKKWRVGIAPDIEIVEKKDTYKIFWLVRQDNKKVLIDSISGDWEEL